VSNYDVAAEISDWQSEIGMILCREIT